MVLAQVLVIQLENDDTFLVAVERFCTSRRVETVRTHIMLSVEGKLHYFIYRLLGDCSL